MRKKLREEISEALGEINRPGSFCAGGQVPAILPGLEVEGLGPIGLPLTVKQAKELKRHCKQAPYGKGEKTVVDTSVRRVWRLEPDHFSLSNPEWDQFLKTTLGKVQDELGLETQALECHLYDLLLYEPGSFFLPHRDGEKLNRMVATLVVVLPSAHEGGELVVRHEGQERTFDFQGGEKGAFSIQYAAFYADCEHEVRPLLKGYRLCLIYNLTLAKTKKATKFLTAPRVSEHLEQICPLVSEWANDESARSLVITLEHQYTESGIAWDTLKGVDRVKAQVVLQAARQADCRVFLGLLTFWESGEAEETGIGRRRWYEDSGDDAAEYRMGEIYETSLTAEHLRDGEGRVLPIRKLNIESTDLLDSESLTDVKPKEAYEGYTGNEGMTFERWYRHAAIFLWPKRRHFEILCDRDSRELVPLLSQMVLQWGQAKGKEAVELKLECLELATAILANWTERKYASTRFEEPGYEDLLKALTELGDSALIARFFREVMNKDVSVDPGEGLVSTCRTLGWETFSQELQTVMEETNNETVARNVRLLEHLCLAKPRKQKGWNELCQTLAQALVKAIKSVDQNPLSSDWRTRKVDPADLLTRLVRALVATGQSALLSEVVTHALAMSRRYPLRDAHLPALVGLQPWLKKHLKGSSAALAQWANACREQLESHTSRIPEEPTDFRRAAAVGCTCQYCVELKRFLEDPQASEHRFGLRKELRRHLASTIHSHKCDLDLQTDENRNPHVLICRKNKASYHERLKVYYQDQESLKTVRAIEASLSK